MNDIRLMNKQKGLYFILLCTALMGLIGTYFYLYLLKDSPAFLVTSLIATYPLITTIAGYIFLNEVASFTQLIGVITIIAGVGILRY
jgi:drug/metabolite transporter (DMT)-like permease